MRAMKSARVAATIAALVLTLVAPAARADIDGHGPDAWRVTGVAANDVLNVRMGPGTDYPVIETFAPNERGLQQITCVPYYTAAHYSAMTAAQIEALPPRWCLMRDADMRRAGWVAQRFITPDDAESPAAAAIGGQDNPPMTGDPMLDAAQSLVRDLYATHLRGLSGQGGSPLESPLSDRYFTAEIIDYIESGQLGADPLFDGQDFDGELMRIAPDPDIPMLRGMITINADHINFGRPARTVLYLRADPERPGAPLRIFLIENEGWSVP